MATRTSATPLARVIQLAEKCEHPTLAFSTATLGANLARLKALSRRTDCEFLLAVKSFPRPEALVPAGVALAGFDISNRSEYRLIPKSQGKSRRPRSVWLTSPGALQAPALRWLSEREPGLVVNCESAGQLAELARVRQQMAFALRVNTDSILRKGSSRFGFSSIEQAFRGVRGMSRHHLIGLHFHHGWHRNGASDYLRLAKAAIRESSRYGVQLQALNLGGGLAHLSWAELEALLRQVRRIVPAETRVIFEPGRLITRDAGFAIGRVIQTKAGLAGEPLAILNLSRLAHLHWSNPSLMAFGNAHGKHAITLFGPTCAEEDRIGRFRGPRLSEGDPVIFAQISGYSLAWNRSFNGIPRAKEIFF